MERADGCDEECNERSPSAIAKKTKTLVLLPISTHVYINSTFMTVSSIPDLMLTLAVGVVKDVLFIGATKRAAIDFTVGTIHAFLTVFVCSGEASKNVATGNGIAGVISSMNTVAARVVKDALFKGTTKRAAFDFTVETIHACISVFVRSAETSKNVVITNGSAGVFSQHGRGHEESPKESDSGCLADAVNLHP